MAAELKTKRKSKGVSRPPVYVGEHLVVDPRVCHGELTFRGTRVSVATALSYLGRGYSVAYLRKSWPEVSAEVPRDGGVAVMKVHPGRGRRTPYTGRRCRTDSENTPSPTTNTVAKRATPCRVGRKPGAALSSCPPPGALTDAAVR